MNYLPRDVIAALTGDGDKNRVVSWLRRKCDAQTLNLIFSKLPLNKDNLADNLFGNLFPSDWENCISQRLHLGFNNGPRAIQWHLSTFSLYAKSIRSHVQFRDSFSSAVLSGNWKTAEITLAEHQKTFGKSVWSLAQYFLLQEEAHGNSMNKAVRDSFAKSNGQHLISTLAVCFSIRAEKTSSLRQFESLLKTFIGEEHKLDLKIFFHLLLTPQPIALVDNIGELLSLIEVLPLIDRFEIFCRIAMIGAAQNHADSRRLSLALQVLYQTTDDPVLHSASETLLSADLNLTAPDAAVIELWDLYTLGSYERCVQQAQTFAESQPLIFQGHELLVKAMLYSKRTPAQMQPSPLASLWHHLFTIYDKGELTEDSLSFLGSLALRLNETSVSWPLMAVCEFHSNHSQDLQLQRLSTFVQRAHGPRNVEHGFTNRELTAYVQKLRIAVPRSISISFFHSIANGDLAKLQTFEPPIPALRMLFFEGVAALRHGRYIEAVNRLEEFLTLSRHDKHPSSPFAVEEARIALAGVYVTLGNCDRLQRIVNEAYLERPHSVKRFSLVAIYRACYSARAITANDISFPILAHIACDEPHSITLAVKAFLSRHNVKKPSELVERAESFPRPQLVTFLLRVCTLDVLDSLLCMKFTAQVEAERIVILNWLSKLQPAGSSIHQAEILRITENAELRDALEWIEVNRVAVNLAGIKEAEELKFREAYLRFAAYRELIPHISEIRLRLLGYVEQTTIYSAPREEIKRFISAKEGHERLFHFFSDAFRQILDVFLNSSQFGLDSCLSVRIRHGILAQHVRRPFSANRLFIDPSDLRAPEIVAYWIQNQSIPVESGPELLEILSSLSKGIIEIIKEVKDSWVQVTTEPNNYGAVFNYVYSENALEAVFSRGDYVQAEYNQFLDCIFGELLDRTRGNLIGVRKRIETELASNLAGCIVNAEQRIMSFATCAGYGLLQDAISRCKSDVERSLQTMQRWFQGADAALLEDVTFEMAVSTAIGMANRLYPGIKQRIREDVSSEFRLQGKFFSGFVHLLFFLMENAMRHCGLQLSTQSIGVTIRAVESSVQIEVANKLADDVNGNACVEIINDKIAEFRTKSDYSKVRSEGGSGLAKINATLSLEFGCKNYVCCARWDAGILTVTTDFAAIQIMK